jgi:voltage-gated potassium channel
MRLTTPGSRLSARPRFQIRYALGTLAVAVMIGTLGFQLIEGWSVADSLYVTVQTVTTVGYGDLTPRTAAGRAFASVFMFLGFGTVAYILSSTVQWIVQSEMIAALGERRRKREMEKLRHHFIICGAGRVGSRIIREMERAAEPFVVIETDAQKVAALVERNKHVLVRDATLEATLREAGVEHARGLAACLPDDADNVYVVLTARDLNRDLHIVARAVEEQAEAKLLRAGANRVVAPTIIGSHRMAQALMKPAIADFMDSITAENLDLGFEELEVAAHSPYAGHKLRFTNIGSELNIVIVAIRSRLGEMRFNPSGDTIIEAGDVMIAIGRAESLGEFNRLARGMK